MEIDLTDVERLAWEGLLREQQEAKQLAREIGTGARVLATQLPRVAAILNGIGEDLFSDHTARSIELATAVAKAHGKPEPQVAPSFTPAANGRPALLTWPDAPAKPDEALDAAKPVAAFPVADQPPTP